MVCIVVTDLTVQLRGRMSFYRYQILYGNRSIRRERVFRDRSNPLDAYSNKDLYDRCRFDKDGLIYLDELLGEDLRHPTRRSCALSSLQQIFIALRFLSSGTFYIIDGDVVNVSKATVSRCITSVTEALRHKVNETMFVAQYVTQSSVRRHDQRL